MQKSSNQRGDANFELQRVFASAWNKRLTPTQWGRAIKDHFGPRAATSPLLCGSLPAPYKLSADDYSLHYFFCDLDFSYLYAVQNITRANKIIATPATNFPFPAAIFFHCSALLIRPGSLAKRRMAISGKTNIRL